MLFFCLQGTGQLRANFSGTPLQGCAPLVVQFSDMSTGNPTSWQWDLGNGNTSTQQNPGAIYFNPGIYTVKLVVRNGATKDSLVRTGYVTVSDKPGIDFTANDTAGCSPFFVQFTDKTNAGTGTVTQWQWDFGDGNSSTMQSPSNLYVASGSYTITLKVTNSVGCFNTLTKSAYINVAGSPMAGFNTASATSCSPPVTVTFTNTSSGSGITGYSWDFGDGNTANSANPLHNYTTAGVFNTILVATNQAGCTDTVSKLISIGSVTPDFVIPDTVCVNVGFNVTNTSSPATLSAFWTFGDATSSTQTNPFKTYSSAGTYNIKLVNNFGACTDSVTKTIVVSTSPIAWFSFTPPPAGCSLPVNVSFTSTSLGANTYQWDFGDGGSSTLASTVHTYTVKGVYSVTLIVRNSRGCVDTFVKQNIISITDPVITSIDGLPYSGCIPYTGTFTPIVSSSESITSYLWDLGDGTTSTFPAPTHTYSISGSYDVSLIVTTASGCKDTLVLPRSVMTGSRPTANFIAAPLVSCANKDVVFTNTSAGITTAWTWDFGDSLTSVLENPIHNYVDTGFFTITFIAENNGCKDTIVKTNYVYIIPPVSSFSTRDYCDTPYLKRFINKSKGGITYLWDFGDGNTSILKTPSHTYAIPGAYLVSLRVDNPPCFDEFKELVYVLDGQPGISVPTAIACKNSPVVITATGVNPAYITQYLWIFGDTTAATGASVPQITHSYTASGVYNITLKTTDLLGCNKTVTLPNAVTIYGPKARLSYPSGACINSTVTFTNQSAPYPGFPIVSWTIDYGDGTVVTTTNPVFTHVYNNIGPYDIKLIVKDSYGCTDTLNEIAGITIARVTVGFDVLDSLACRQSLINFISTSVGSTLSYLWKFGDGGTSTLRTPTHLYTTDGLYTVLLIVTDRFGCIDSVKKDSAVIIGNASAAFLASDSIIICPPAQVRFTNKSTNFASLKWDFDDGSTSTLANPNHFFLNGGIYNVKLVVKGFGNCPDSVVKQIRVRGPQGSLSYLPIGKCVPATINFTATVSNITGNFIWDFGDGVTVTSTGNTISHSYGNVGQYVPKLLLRDTSINCTVSIFGNDTISVSDAKAYIQQPQNLFCDSVTINFLDSSIIRYDTVSTYNWTFGDGGTSATQNPVHTYTTPGIYTINMSLQSIYGCKDTAAPVQVKVVKSPLINVTGITTTCVSDSVTFSLTLALPDTSFTKYQWTFGNGNSSTLVSPPAQSYTTANTYTVKAIAINSSGCTDTVLKTLIVYPLPPVYAGADTSICRGQSIKLFSSGALSYTWQASPTLSCTACANPVATPDSTIKYVVTGTSTNGCNNKDSLTVAVVQPFALLTSLRDTICRGETISLSASGADSYAWSPAAGLSSIVISNPSASPDTTTIYQVIGTDYENCFADTAYIPVIVYNTPQFDIIPDIISVVAGTSVTLTTTGSADIISYSWTPPTGLSCTTCPQPQATPTANTTTYTAVVKNAGGCSNNDKVTINLLCGTGNIFIPNTFSPNGDGANDVFYPRGKGIKGIRNLLIYNRWGSVVFQRSNFNINDENAGWNGTYKGQPAPQDVYVYHLDVICGTGNQFLYKGDVTLIR